MIYYISNPNKEKETYTLTEVETGKVEHDTHILYVKGLLTGGEFVLGANEKSLSDMSIAPVMVKIRGKERNQVYILDGYVMCYQSLLPKYCQLVNLGDLGECAYEEKSFMRLVNILRELNFDFYDKTPERKFFQKPYLFDRVVDNTTFEIIKGWSRMYMTYFDILDIVFNEGADVDGLEYIDIHKLTFNGIDYTFKDCIEAAFKDLISTSTECDVSKKLEVLKDVVNDGSSYQYDDVELTGKNYVITEDGVPLFVGWDTLISDTRFRVPNMPTNAETIPKEFHAPLVGGMAYYFDPNLGFVLVNKTNLYPYKYEEWLMLDGGDWVFNVETFDVVEAGSDLVNKDDLCVIDKNYTYKTVLDLPSVTPICFHSYLDGRGENFIYIVVMLSGGDFNGKFIKIPLMYCTGLIKLINNSYMLECITETINISADIFEQQVGDIDYCTFNENLRS